MSAVAQDAVARGGVREFIDCSTVGTMGSWSRVYAHITWSTWDRIDAIDERVERAVFAIFNERIRSLRCEALAVGGTTCHVHLCIRLHPAVAIAELVRSVKSASSLVVERDIRPEAQFRWQGGYGVVSIREGELPTVVEYVERQKEHHAANTVIEALERTDE